MDHWRAMPTNEEDPQDRRTVSGPSDLRGREIKGWLWAALAILALFLLELVFCREVYLSPPGYIRTLTREEWAWLIGQPGQFSHDIELPLIFLNECVEAGGTLALVVGHYRLVWRKGTALPVGRGGKWLILLLGVVMGVLGFLYVKYCAAHYLLYMMLILPAILSVTLLLAIRMGSKG